MFSNSSGCVRRPVYFIVYWKAFFEFSPSEPVEASRFCSASTAVMSEGMRRYCAMTSGLSQIRIE